jgi:hypothetical protein
MPSVHFDFDELEHADQDFLCDLLNTNKYDKQMLFDLNESIDVVLKVLYDKMYVDMYHTDNHNDVRY